jgi:hypothetical protein
MMNRIHHVLALGLAFAVAGCAGTAKSTPTTASTVPATQEAAPLEPPPHEIQPQAAANETPIDVRMLVEALTRTGQHMVAPTETLRSGDRMAIQVGVDQPAYVYVALAAADGTSSLLFPKSGDQLVKPRTITRIPPAGQWFRLDKDTGQEDLFVYASRQPLGTEELQTRMKSDTMVAKSLVTTAKTPSKPRKPKSAAIRTKPAAASAASAESDAPAGLSSSTRGLELDSEEPAQTQNGVTAVHFAIRHSK